MPDLIWQQRAVNHLKGSEGGVIWAKVGEGKSRVGLRLFARLQKELPAICVLVCRKAAFWDWENEIRKCGYLDWVVEEYDPSLPRFFKKGVTVWLVSHAMLEKQWASLTWFPQIKFIIYDELYLFSNPKAKRTIAATDLSKRVEKKVGMAGTIMPARDNTTVWGQAGVIGIQHLLARNLTEFRKRYQTCRLIKMGTRKVPLTKNKPNSKAEILKRLENNIFLHFPKHNSRKVLHKFNSCPITDQQKQIIKQLKEEYYAELPKGRELEIKVAIELVIKIQQIANGWITDSEGRINFIKSNKPQALSQSVSELVAAGEQCVIWCAFRNDLGYLAKHLNVPTLQMCGGKDFDIQAFKSGRYPVVLATEAMGSSFNHFKDIQYAKYFSTTFRWLDLQQSRGRTDRKDSIHNRCHYEYFLVEKTLDKHAFETASISGATEKQFIKTGQLKSWLTNQ